MDKSSIEQIFMFFNCTMSRDIPQMGKILRLYILEILGHPNVWSDLPEQGFSGFESDLGDLSGTFPTNIDNMSVIFRKPFKVSCSNLREGLELGYALEEAVSNIFIRVSIFTDLEQLQLM